MNRLTILAFALVVVFGFLMGAASKNSPQWVTSGDGQHRWLISGGKQWVGFHNDRIGPWIDLRSGSTKGYPEFAVYVPKDGGAPKLQVCRTGEEPVTLDLVKVARLLDRMIAEEAD